MGCGSSSAEKPPAKVKEENKRIEQKEHREGDETHKKQYQDIDQHAKRAPNSLRNSVDELVQYMMRYTKDHRLLSRGFFIWIAENIRYDLDGLLGRQARAPNDVVSVMKNGLSVCEGVAGIEVKKLSGYSKGFGYSGEEPITSSQSTDHAWNAVKLEGKWYLLDSTWGAGHADGHNYVKEFCEFYFLTDPAEFANDHFPYMNNNMEESLKWQLLKNPISLEEFNKNVHLKSHAFSLGVVPISHKKGFFEVSDEAELTFKWKKEPLQFSADLRHIEGNMIRTIRDKTLASIVNGVCTITIHPPQTGKYELNIFAKKRSDDGNSLQQVAVYYLRCKSVKESEFAFPTVYSSSHVQGCKMIKPKNAMLPSNSIVDFEVLAPHLEMVSINKQMLQKEGSSFKGKIKTGDKGYQFNVSAAVKEGNITTFEGMFQYYTA
ncbi:kyphoscoliosis peptidase-like isoform X2 [Mya arenaria]|nr:kyphoscoliosis peptidase-like isoform X2 [Mya arenaria]